MNIEILGREAINRIKQTWGLPKTGFIAGGSIANIVWELVSGNKAVVNDIDVFILDSIIEKMDTTDENYYEYKEKDYKYYEDYTGMCCWDTLTLNFYTIVNSEKDGMFNIVSYKSNTADHQSIVIKSFDINSTKIGYSIDEDKIYWEPEFEEFLKTGKLKICNVTTPSHTAIRIAKKSKELNTELDPFELKMLQFALEFRFSDAGKYKFMNRYYEMFNNHIDILGEFFSIEKKDEAENFVKINYNKIVDLYALKPKFKKTWTHSWDGPSRSDIFNDNNLIYLSNSGDFIFYMRNIHPDEKLRKIWKSIRFFFSRDLNYIDGDFPQEDIELLSRMGHYAPNSIEHLRGLKLSKQIEIIKKVFEKFKDDPIIAISILEKNKIGDIELDDQTALLLELSVRKQIINDTKGKARKILNKKEEDVVQQIQDYLK